MFASYKKSDVVLNVSLEDTARRRIANYTHSQKQIVCTNVVPKKVIVTLKAEFSGPIIGSRIFTATRWKTDYRNYAKPPWIRYYRLGITRTNATLSSRQTGLISIRSLLCRHVGRKVVLSKNAPSSPVVCTLTVYLSRRTSRQNDRLNVDINIENGGYLVIANMDVSSQPTTTHFYSGTTKRVTASFIFDRIAPVHCSVDNSIDCSPGITSSSMLSVNSSVTRESTINVTWDGWYDTVGISAYTLEIYEMESKANSLSEKASPLDRQRFAAQDRNYSLQLSNSSLISIVLYVHDVAGNYRIARRFVLYDESSTVKVDSNNPLSLPRSVNTGHTLWKTVNKDQLFCNWTGHFYNSLLKRDPLLKRISPFRTNIDKNYDQPATGTLDLSGTINYAGIVNYKYAISYGSNPQVPGDSTFRNVPTRATGLDLWQHYTISTSTNDGNHITVWVKAVDIWGNSETDNIVINVDFSVPSISDLGLTRDGQTGLTLHGSTKLHTIKVAFNAEDPQSGILSAFWALGETRGGSQMGQGRIITRAKSQSDCDQSNCTCTPLLVCSYFSYNLELRPEQSVRESGQHARTYYLTINATNNAQLSSSHQLAITVDGSPPLAGHVIDGISGQLDIDSQQSNIIRAHWQGFSDPDNGIHHYKYAIETTCLSKEQITSGKMKVYRTSNQYIDPITVNTSGTYYVSVVAYNNALEPSDVICSDGVTVDDTPPKIQQISVDHLRSAPGLIKQNTSKTIWLLDENRRRQLLQGVETVCDQNALLVSDVDIYPLASVDVSSVSPHQTQCPYGPSSPNLFTQVSSFLSVSWKGSDKESGIHDYEVGIGRTQFEDPPSVLPFHSTTGISSYNQKIASLTEGIEYFLIVRATNKVGLKTKKAVGPIIVDITAPRVTEKLSVYDNTQEKSFSVSWTAKTFTDAEDASLQYKVGAGIESNRDNLVPFTTIDQFSSCQMQDTCVNIPLNNLQKTARKNRTIYFIVQATNSAGLSVTTSSGAYNIHVHHPSANHSDIDQCTPDSCASEYVCVDQVDGFTCTSNKSVDSGSALLSVTNMVWMGAGVLAIAVTVLIVWIVWKKKQQNSHIKRSQNRNTEPPNQYTVGQHVTESYQNVAMTTFENEHVEQSGNEQKDYANSQKVDSYSSETSSKIKGNTIGEDPLYESIEEMAKISGGAPNSDDNKIGDNIHLEEPEQYMMMTST
ncbi:uncharacterized protein LOC134197685 [Corticium candelabrum]|uniref:uncharacterized protein LOC134197685 n=1 Tax=Corticium candelabrum TaxID=121492 RepID=UPI002E262073|nr:uncharacterized protein LOC134197685 [Corticium candelabrum]